MIVYFFEFAKTFAIVFLLNDYFRRHYTNEHRDFFIDMSFYFINVGYYLLYIYSYCEYTFNKCIKYIKENTPFFKIINEFIKKNTKVLDIDFIQDNYLICSKSKNYYLSNNVVEILPKCDFILYTDTTNFPFNKKIISYDDSIVLHQNNEIYKCQKIDYKFIMVEFIVGNKSYSIHLETQKYNFYIKDNVLDKKFFLYYLKYIHPEKKNFKESDIQTLKIIDQNVCVKNIDFTKENNACIRLNVTDYDIIIKP
jgi:hypothetical protein